jgi:hypothetical protein
MWTQFLFESELKVKQLSQRKEERERTLDMKKNPAAAAQFYFTAPFKSSCHLPTYLPHCRAAVPQIDGRVNLYGPLRQSKVLFASEGGA